MHPYKHPRARTTAFGRHRLRVDGRFGSAGSPGIVCGRPRRREGASQDEAVGFSLIEIMVTLAIVAVVLALAVPVYQGYSVRAYRTQAQADLLRCAQGMERHAALTMGYGNAVDLDGDGRGDQSTGPVSQNLCKVASTHYRLSVRSADAANFVLRAEASGATSPVAADGAMELDAAGERRWDRNDDGDFGDDGERRWGA
ncbi:MAG: prepilin-type N-terminal cleavage/methylation domain-containing protein [Pseudomonadales bacterium]|nr:prepilin-type N-terminal cleavage/methylation domain-containing protein [Pseudomonadales bacterium]